MAITGITIYQDNIIGSVNVMAVHSPLVFLVDVDYTGQAPDFIYCEILREGATELTVRCVYESDISAGLRRFRFVADEILRAYMPALEDQEQSGGSVIEADISQVFTINFKSDLAGTIQLPIVIEACNAARQIGSTACMTDVCLNSNDLYIGFANKPVYVYFYNLEDAPPVDTSYALDYDDAFFVDYDDSKFVIF